MTVMSAEKPLAVVPEVLEVDGEEILSEFARIMLEWGHYKTARGLRYPTRPETKLVAAFTRARNDRSRTRREDGTWIPIP